MLLMDQDKKCVTLWNYPSSHIILESMEMKLTYELRTQTKKGTFKKIWGHLGTFQNLVRKHKIAFNMNSTQKHTTLFRPLKYLSKYFFNNKTTQ